MRKTGEGEAQIKSTVNKAKKFYSFATNFLSLVTLNFHNFQFVGVLTLWVPIELACLAYVFMEPKDLWL